MVEKRKKNPVGNPQIILGDPVNDVVLQENLYRNSVESIRFSDKGIYLGGRSGKTDDDEPPYVSGQMIYLERLNTICDGEVEDAKAPPLIQRPPFISPKVWEAFSGIDSFTYIKDRFVFPTPLIPNKYFQQNGLTHGDDPNIPADKKIKSQTWNWTVSGTDSKDITDYTEVLKFVDLAGNSLLHTKTINGLANNDLLFMLDLTSAAKKGSPSTLSSEAEFAMSSIGTDNRLGSFMLTLGNIKKVQNSGPKDKDGAYIKSTTQNNSTGDLKEDAAGALTISIGPDIYVTIETNSNMKIKLNGVEGNSKTVKLSGIEGLFTDNPGSLNLVRFIFMPVFNGLVIAVAPMAGNWHDKKEGDSNSIYYIEKNPGVDPMQYTAKGHAFNINNQTDVQIEAKGPPELNIGNSMMINFTNCTGYFSYTPVFFSPEARGAYYFFSGADAASNNEADKPHYRLLPVWCKNKTSAALYPFKNGSNEKYPKGYTPGNTDVRGEVPQALPVVLKRDFKLNINSAKGYSNDPKDGSGKLDWFIQFATSLSDGSVAVTPAAGEMVIIEGSHAGKYKVSNATSGLITCENPSGGTFNETSLSDTIMRLADPNVKDRKIVFGISSGKQEDEIDPEEEDKDLQKAFTASMARMAKEKYPRFPPQLFGFLRVTMDQIQNNVDNKIKNQFNLGTNWQNFITNVSITHNESSGTSGSMTIDRYGLSQYCANYDRNILIQQVAGLNLDVKYVGTQADDYSGKTYATNLSERDGGNGSQYIGSSSWSYNQANRGLLLKGIAYGQGASDSYSANEMNVPLFGLQKKLEEIKILNAPFFDGRTVLYTLKYLASYGSVAMNFDNASPNDLLPASSNISVAIVDFKLGTSVWDAMNQVAELTGHMFVLQPDGVIWWYKVSDSTGIPFARTGHQMWTYPNSRVVSSTSDPDFSQFYNHIIVMAMQAPTTNVKNPLEVVDLPLQPLIAGARLRNTNPDISWSKLCVLPQTSFFTEKELNKIAYRYTRQAQSILWNGSTTIPGNLAIKLLDTFSNNPALTEGEALSDDAEMRGEFLISGITHNVDIVSKNFTTQLNISMIGNAWYDSAGFPKIDL